MKIKYQEKELFETETFLVPTSGEVEITIGQNNDSIKFILEFIDSDNNEQDFNFDMVNNRVLKIILNNWKNSLGTSFVEPVEIGTLFHRKLFILLLVRKIGAEGDVREITFTSYLGEEVQNGNN